MDFIWNNYFIQILWTIWQICQASKGESHHRHCTIEAKLIVCSHKNLKSVPEWHPNATITKLLLDSNMITAIKDTNFRALPSLHNLTIASNHLQTLSNNSFSGLKHLVYLNLAHNNLTSITRQIFGSELKTLLHLHLEFNKIRKIPRDVFDNLINLKELHLEQNSLTLIHKHSFNKLRAIQWLTIDHNYLNNASVDWFRPINSTLLHFSMNHNPWICDFRTCEYRKWLDTFAKTRRKLYNMLNIWCCHDDYLLTTIDSAFLCGSPSHVGHLKVTTNSTASLPCKDSSLKSPWTVLSMKKNGTSACHKPVWHLDERLVVRQGELVIQGAHKNHSGRYCCLPDKTHNLKCTDVKVTSRNFNQTTTDNKSASQGAALAICIIAFTALLCGAVYFCRRKRRQYGVLRDTEVPPNNDEKVEESSNFSRNLSYNAKISEVQEACV